MAPRQQTAAINTARVPDGTRVYGIGDVHGRLDLLKTLLRRIHDDAQDAPARRVMIYLGDVVDRGPQSSEVVEHLIQGPDGGFERIVLKGNHEDMMEQVINGAAVPIVRSWLANGGDETLRSYGVSVPSPLPTSPALLRRLGQMLGHAVPPGHQRWLAKRPCHHTEGDYVFVHAGIKPGVALQDQHDHDLMWIRDAFLDTEQSFGPVIVHGHTISPQPVQRTNRIGIDTGAYQTGVLSCLVLQGTSQRFLST